MTSQWSVPGRVDSAKKHHVYYYISTKSQMNVLGIIFDTGLQWGPQITSTLKKANKGLNAIRLIKNYFSTNELLTIVSYLSIWIDNKLVCMDSS